MKRFLLLLLFSLTSLMADKPNVIVILVDDMGYSDLGCFGGEISTPNIDKLGKNGLRFTQSYNSARCCPSRASLLTGLYSHLAGIADFTSSDISHKKGPAYKNSLNDQSVTLAEVLKTNGYSTYGVGKWHVGNEIKPTTRGFDHFYGYVKGYAADQWVPSLYQRLPEHIEPEIQYKENEFYATDAFTDYALEFIKQGQKKEKPFFLYLAHSSPHFPIQAPAKTRDKYVDIYKKGWDYLKVKRYNRQENIGLLTESWKFTDRSEVPVEKNDDIANGFSGKQNPAWDTLDLDRQTDLAYRMATFAAMVEHVDQGVGKIIKHLKSTQDFDNTLILFTSDNGACYEWGPYGFDQTSRRAINTLHKDDQLKIVGGPGTHHSVGSAWSSLSNTPMRMYKHFNFEGGNCSPLIAHWPKGIKNHGRWVRTPIHLIDVMPTVCEVTLSNYPTEYNNNKITPVSGLSLNPIFNGKQIKNRNLYFDHKGSSAVRQGEWKLVRGNYKYKNRTWELYNIKNDRCETKNLIAQYPEKAKELEALWLDWAVKVKLNPYYKHSETK